MTNTERRADFRRVDAELLGAAGQLFAEGGPEAVTVSAVATRAGVSRATVHRHVGTRAELLWAVTGQIIADLGGDMSRGLAQGVGQLVDHIVSDPTRARRALWELSGTGADGDGRSLLDREIAMMRILAAAPAGRPGIDAEVLAVINLAGLLLWSVLDDQGIVTGGAERYRLEIVRLLVHGAVDPAHLPELVGDSEDGLPPAPKRSTPSAD